MRKMSRSGSAFARFGLKAHSVRANRSRGGYRE